jgi:hypothetical protein
MGAAEKELAQSFCEQFVARCARGNELTNFFYQVHLPFHHLLLPGRRTGRFPVLG